MSEYSEAWSFSLRKGDQFPESVLEDLCTAKGLKYNIGYGESKRHTPEASVTIMGPKEDVKEAFSKLKETLD